MTRALPAAIVGVLLSHVSAMAASRDEKHDGPAYVVTINAIRPHEANVQLRMQTPIARLSPARGGDGSAVRDVRCSDGRPAQTEASAWQMPPACTDARWTVTLQNLDGKGVDASAPRAAVSLKHRYWLFVERDGLLRASDARGRMTIRLTGKGRIGSRKNLLFPAVSEPPFIGVVAEAGGDRLRRHELELTQFGPSPRYGWLAAVNDGVLATWSRWRRDLGYGDAPQRLDWVWVEPKEKADPGFTASAGTEAILAQIKERPDDPDFEAKARVVYATTAMHEGFHVISGLHAHGWPAWVNESLASHFAIESSRHLVGDSDRQWLDRFFLSPRTGTPLLEAQRRYAAGDADEGAAFYADGPAFWREIEAVLTVAPNSSGRLAALLASSNGFHGVDLTKSDALARFLDRYSGGRARPIVARYLTGGTMIDE